MARLDSKQEELAEIMGRPRRLVNELVAGKKAITPETARDLGAAFGTGSGTVDEPRIRLQALSDRGGL